MESFFKGFGKIRDINFKHGYRFVEFEDARDEDNAVYEINNRSLFGKRTTVEHAKRIPQLRNFYNNRWGDRYRGRRGVYGSKIGGYDHNEYCSFNDRNKSKYSPALKTKYRLNVENKLSRTGWQDLKHLFRSLVEVTNAEAHQGAMREGILEFHSQQNLTRQWRSLMEQKPRKLRHLYVGIRCLLQNQSGTHPHKWDRS